MRYASLCRKSIVLGMIGVGTFLLISAQAAGPAAPPIPNPSELDDPFPIRRVLLAGDRLAKELERVKQGILIQMPLKDFEEQVRSASTGQKIARDEPRLLEMRYRARLLNTTLDDNGLDGTASWTIYPGGNVPAILPVDAMQLAAHSARWPDNRLAIFSALDRQNPNRLGLLLEQAGDRLLEFSWSARGLPTPTELRFDLATPPCAQASLDLELPRDWVPFLAQSEALLTGPFPIPNSSKQNWHVAFGGLAHLELMLRPQDSARRMNPIRTRSVTTVQDVHPALLFTQSQIEFEALHGGVTDLVVEHDPDWTPSEVSVLNLENWKRDARSNRLRIHLREPARGGQLRIVGSAPIRVDRALEWTSPGIKLVDSIAGFERLELRMDPELQFYDWKPGSFRLMKRDVGPERVEILNLQSGISGQGSADGRPRCKFRLRGSEYSVQQNTVWNITPERSSLAAAVTLKVSQGMIGHIPFHLPPGWELERIEGADPASPQSFSTRVGPDSQVVVDLVRPLAAGSELELLLHLKQRSFDPRADVGLSIPFPDVIPVGASRRSGNLMVRVDPAFDVLAPQAMPEPGRSGPALPMVNPELNTWNYTYIGPGPVGSFYVRLSSPKLKVRSQVHVYPSAGSMEVSQRLDFQSDVSGPKALTLVSLAPLNQPLRWKEVAGSNSLRSIDRLSQSPLAFLAGLGGSHALDSGLRVGTPRSDEWWQVQFTRPLTRPQTLELTCTVRFPLCSSKHWPGLAGLGGTIAAIFDTAPPFAQTIPLFQTLDATDVRGEVALAIQPGSGIEWLAHGLTPMTNPLSVYPAFHYGSEAIRLSLKCTHGQTATGLPALDGARLTTRADRSGTRRCQIQFRVRPCGARSLPIQFPPGTTVESATIDGRSLDELNWTVQKVGAGVECVLPLPSGDDWRTIAIRYNLPAVSGALVVNLESPLPQLPVAFPSVRCIWNLGPGVLPVSTTGLVRRPGGADSSFQPPWELPYPWLNPFALEKLVTHSVDSDWGRVAVSTAAAQSKTYQQMFLQLAAEPVVVLLDNDALLDLAITPARVVPAVTGPPTLESLGLVAVGIPSGVVLTTPRTWSRWRAEADNAHHLPASISAAVQQAKGSGRDSSSRFQMVSDWLETAKFTRENFASHSVLPEEAGWTTWESTGVEKPVIPIVYVHTWQMLGWIIAGLFLALAIALASQAGRLGIIFLAIWLAGNGLLLNALPLSLRGICVGPLCAGFLLALRLVWRFRSYPRSLTQDRTELIRPSTRKSPSSSGPGVILGLLACCILPAHAAAPETATVFLVAPAKDTPELKFVLVPPDLLERLGQIKERRLTLPPAVITRVEYKGRFAGKSLIEIEARYEVRSFVDDAAVVVPLSGVRLGEVLLDGAKAFQQNDGPDRYRVALNKRGDHRLDLKFSITVNGAGSEREVKFGVPEVFQSELRFAVPGDVEGFQVVNWRGTQHLLDQGRELQTYLGRTRQVHLRWRELGSTSAAQVRVQQASLWDIHPDRASLFSVLDYRISQEGVTRFRVAVPKGLEVARLEIRPDLPAPTPLPAWIKDWNLTAESEPGAYRTLTIDLYMALSGSVRMVLQLVPRRPLSTHPELRFPAALDVIESQARVAFRLTGLEMGGEPPHAVMGDLTAASFLDETWKRINEEKNPLAVTRAYRILPDHEGWLKPILKPVPTVGKGKSEMVWWLDPHRWDVRGNLSFTATTEALSVVEWDLSPSVKIHSVRGSNLERWTRTGGRVQVWLKLPARDVQLEWNGSMMGHDFPPQTLALELPGVRLINTAEQDANVRLQTPEGVSVTVERPEVMGQIFVPSTIRETAIQLSRPAEGIRVVVHTPQRDSSFSVFSTVEVKEGNLSIRSEIRAALNKDQPHSFTLHARQTLGWLASLDLPTSARLADSAELKDGRSWNLEITPRQSDEFAMVLNLQRPLAQMTELVLPTFSITQEPFISPRCEQWVALPGPQVKVLRARRFFQLDSSDPSLPKPFASAPEIWKQQDLLGELVVVASPTAAHLWHPVRIALADLQATQQGNQWVYRATLSILHWGASPLQMDVGGGSTIEGVVIDGTELQLEAGTTHATVIPLSAEGYRFVQCVWHRSSPSWQSPTFSSGAGHVPIDRTLWTINVPPGMIATGSQPTPAAQLDLDRAQTLMDIAGATEGIPISEDAQLRALSLASSWIRIAEAEWASQSGATKTAATDGKSISERAKKLRDRAQMLRNEHARAETGRPAPDRDWGFQQLPEADAFQNGTPIRYALTSTETFLSIEIQEAPSDTWQSRWLPMIVVTAAVGMFTILVLAFRRSTRPEQLALIGIVGAAAFPFHQGVVFLTLTLLGALMRVIGMLLWVFRRF